MYSGRLDSSRRMAFCAAERACDERDLVEDRNRSRSGRHMLLGPCKSSGGENSHVK